MIIDKVKNYKIYLGMNKYFDKALELMANFDPETPVGTYEVDGDNLYYFVAEPEMGPLEGGRFESHFKYIDLQYIIRGGEWIKYTNLENVTPDERISEDCQLYTGDGATIRIKPGEFWAAFPEDAHMPGKYQDAPTDLKKVIFKVKMW